MDNETSRILIFSEGQTISKGKLSRIRNTYGKDFSWVDIEEIRKDYVANYVLDGTKFQDYISERIKIVGYDQAMIDYDDFLISKLEKFNFDEILLVPTDESFEFTKRSYAHSDVTDLLKCLYYIHTSKQNDSKRLPISLFYTARSTGKSSFYPVKIERWPSEKNKLIIGGLSMSCASKAVSIADLHELIFKINNQFSIDKTLGINSERFRFVPVPPPEPEPVEPIPLSYGSAGEQTHQDISDLIKKFNGYNAAFDGGMAPDVNPNTAPSKLSDWEVINEIAVYPEKGIEAVGTFDMITTDGIPMDFKTQTDAYQKLKKSGIGRFAINGLYGASGIHIADHLPLITPDNSAYTYSDYSVKLKGEYLSGILDYVGNKINRRTITRNSLLFRDYIPKMIYTYGVKTSLANLSLLLKK